MGRGSLGVGVSAVKRVLKKMAKRGEMPQYFAGGTVEDKAEIMREIDKLYPMPQTNATITDQGDAVWVNFGNSVSKAYYPSKEDATASEKNGVLKWLLWNKLKAKK